MKKDADGNRILLCDNPNVSETFLDSELSSDNYSYLLFDNMLGSIVLLSKIRSVLQWNIDNTDRSKVDVLREKLVTVNRKIDSLLDLFSDGVIDKDTINRKAAPFQEQADELRKQIEAYDKPYAQKQYDIDEITATIEKLENRCAEIYDIDNDRALIEYTRKEILDDINYIVVDRFKNLTIVFNSFDEVTKMVEKHTHILPDKLRQDFEQLAATGRYDEIAVKYAQHCDNRPKQELRDIISNLRSEKGINIRWGVR